MCYSKVVIEKDRNSPKTGETETCMTNILVSVFCVYEGAFYGKKKIF